MPAEIIKARAVSIVISARRATDKYHCCESATLKTKGDDRRGIRSGIHSRRDLKIAPFSATRATKRVEVVAMRLQRDKNNRHHSRVAIIASYCCELLTE